MGKFIVTISLTLVLFVCANNVKAQDVVIISGKVTEQGSSKPIANATIHIKGSSNSTMSKIDGSFRLHVTDWSDSVEITCVGFETFTIALQKGHTTNLAAGMKSKSNALQEVVIATSKKPGKSFMQKVIEHKANNNPSRFRSYSYQRYTRSELDIDNIDFQKAKGSGLKSLMIKTYDAIDSTAKNDKELPIYFAESIANNYHSISPNIERENIIAKKKLGLKTDDLLSKLDRFYFQFNVYEDWVPIFDQTYVSPLNSNAFNYYNFFEGDKMLSDNNTDTLQQIRFVPMRLYERAFSGSMWINKTTLAVENVNMHLNKTANLNFVSDINYNHAYKQVTDSTTGKMEYMPFKYTSEVKFESGLALLGIPIPADKSAVKFIIKNTTVINNINLNSSEPASIISNLIRKEQNTNWNKTELYWQQNRPDSLTKQEKNIYSMVDSLKENKRFQRDIKIVAFAGTGFWDIDNKLRFGSYTSFISKNQIEGIRLRLGFWTMPGISKKINIYGYAAYGTKDQKLKGLIGAKYIWNQARWTKTSFSYGADYDFIIDNDDELDKDNIINSLFRKSIPFTRTFTKQALLKHEQYLSPNFTAKASLSYKQLNPVFDFKYRPINPDLDKPYDSVFVKLLPVAEASIGIRYAHKERSKILNYDKIKIGTFFPVLTANYTYGFEQGKAQFNFHKINIGIEQMLQLPPKSMLYYKVEVGKVFGTLPHLLLNVPAGNEYYVASKYQFNTMSPYEFASDKYISLHTRFYLGGALLDKIPFLQKLGWRERFSFNAYWGDMTTANIDYNKSSNFNLIGKAPFMEASIGIGNIFHVLSIEYYRRLNYLNNPYAKKDGIYVGLTLAF
jgi:hypothetical protein